MANLELKQRNIFGCIRFQYFISILNNFHVKIHSNIHVKTFNVLLLHWFYFGPFARAADPLTMQSVNDTASSHLSALVIVWHSSITSPGNAFSPESINDCLIAAASIFPSLIWETKTPKSEYSMLKWAD